MNPSARSTARSSQVASGLGGLRTKYAQIIGVSVSDTAVDTAIAKTSVSESLSMEKPAAHINAQVPASDNGTVTPAATVAAARRRNTNTTSMTSAMVASSVSCMSPTLARMVWLRSDSTEMSMPGEIQRLI